MKKHLPNYEKAQRGLFRDLEDLVEGAKLNAQRTMIDSEETDNPNPSTEIHSLVDHLQNLKTDT